MIQSSVPKENGYPRDVYGNDVLIINRARSDEEKVQSGENWRDLLMNRGKRQSIRLTITS